MSYINKLKNVGNELKVLRNNKSFEYSKLEGLYSKLQIEIDELNDLLSEINKKQYKLLKFEILSWLGLIISIKSVFLEMENSNWILIACIIIFINNTIDNIKCIKEYLLKYNNLADKRDEKTRIIMEAHSITRDIEYLKNEIDNIYEIVKVNDEEKAKDYIEGSSSYLKLVNDMKNM